MQAKGGPALCQKTYLVGINAYKKLHLVSKFCHTFKVR